MNWRFGCIVVWLTVMGVGHGLPNFVFILTDDLDIVLKGLEPLKKVQNLLINKGAIFERAFTSSPICCPSRASILTGRYAHNHQTFNNSKSGGCYSDIWRSDFEPLTFANLLKMEAKYETFFAGKYLNEYHSTEVPMGWDQFFGLCGNSVYYNYKVNENGEIRQYGEEPKDYLTNVIKNHAIDFLMKQNSLNPFLAMISVPAPHAPFTPEDKYNNSFPDVKAYKSESFNKGPDFNTKHWLLTMPPSQLTDRTLNNLDDIYRKRWQTLLSVDDLVEEVVITLDKLDLINDTYIIFTSDNGYHVGQFAQPFDKRMPYETDIKVPLIVRGPNIKPGTIVQQPAALIDLAPTILNWADVEYEFDDFDGIGLNEYFEESAQNETYERHILVEYWGEANDDWQYECPWRKRDKLFNCQLDADCKCQDSWNNTYSCVRHLASNMNFIFCKFKDMESFQEAYDLSEDSNQLENIAYDILPSQQAKYSLTIDHLSECLGESCREIY